MCGRFTLKTAAALWVQELFPGLRLLDVPENPPRYNIAPTQPILAVMQLEAGGDLRVASTRWGLIPSWSEDLSIGAKMINARSETVAEKPSFRKAFSERRCLIIADGYYEWPKGLGDDKQPYWIHRPKGEPFLMAGLYEFNRRITPENPLLTSTILTMNANTTIQAIHDRMPVVIPPRDALRWLAPDQTDGNQLTPLITAAADDFFVAEPVSKYVNNARHEGPDCLEIVRTLF